MFPSTVSTLSLSAIVCPFQIAFAIYALPIVSVSCSDQTSSHMRSSRKRPSRSWSRVPLPLYHKPTGNGKSSQRFLHNHISGLATKITLPPPPPHASSPDPDDASPAPPPSPLEVLSSSHSRS